MSNATRQLYPANRAMLVGTIAAGFTTLALNQQSPKSATEITKTALKAGLVAGGTTYVAEKMAGRPILAMLTVLSVTAAMAQLQQDFSRNES